MQIESSDFVECHHLDSDMTGVVLALSDSAKYKGLLIEKVVVTRYD